MIIIFLIGVLIIKQIPLMIQIILIYNTVKAVQNLTDSRICY